MFNKDKWQYCREYINDYCIERAPPGNERYLSPYIGVKDTTPFYIWQFYTRGAMLNPVVIEMVTDHFFELFANVIPNVQLAGVEASSTSFITAFIIRAHQLGIELNGFNIRKEKKPYGKRNWIEGTVNRKPVLLVDDITSESHKTMFHADKILNLHNIDTINQCYCLIRKQKKADYKPVKLRSGELNIQSMFTLDDFDMTYNAYHKAKAEKKSKQMVY